MLPALAGLDLHLLDNGVLWGVQTEGDHFLVEYWGCSPDAISDPLLVERAMKDAAEAARAHIVACFFRPFAKTIEAPQPGVSGMVVVEESHLSIHTWPEHGYAAVDIYTCGAECKPVLAHKLLRDRFGAFRYSSMTIKRGAADGMRIVDISSL